MTNTNFGRITSTRVGPRRLQLGLRLTFQVFVRIFSLVALTAAAAGASDWVRIHQPPFEIFSSGGDRSAQHALALLTGMRQMFAAQIGTEQMSRLPVRVYLFSSTNEFTHYRPNPVAAGFHVPGTSQDIVAAVDGNDRVLLHEYAHVAVRHAGLRLPLWLSEGTAELYSTVPPGAMIDAHLQTLRRESWLPLKNLLAVDGQSPEYNESRRTSIFYAQSWALVHLLNLSPARRGGLAKLVDLLQEGRGSTEALRRVYGLDEATLQAELQRYMRDLRAPAPQRARSGPADVPVQRLAEVEAQIALFELARAVPRHESARALLSRLRRSFPDHPKVLNALGDEALQAGDDKQALDLYTNALRAGDTSGRLRYEVALLRRAAGEPVAEVERWLREALGREPDLFDAHFLLGNLLLEADRPQEATESLQAAAALQPLNGTVFEQLALALLRLGRSDEAKAAARRARTLAGSEQATARAEALLQSADEPLPRTVNRPEPAPRAKTSGELIQVDCLGEVARLHVRQGTDKVLLLVRDRAAVSMEGARELPCGDVQPRMRITVQYGAQADASYGTSGDAVSIHVH